MTEAEPEPEPENFTSTDPIDPVDEPIDPVEESIKSTRMELYVRLFLSFAAAIICWHEYNAVATAVAFLFVFFFLPTIVPRFVNLSNGRKIRGMSSSITKHFDKQTSIPTLHVHYTASSTKPRDRDKEFREVCNAVLDACDQRKLNRAEITVYLPNRGMPILGFGMMLDSHTAEFQKCGQFWQEVIPDPDLDLKPT